MARKRTKLAPALEADLIARTARGETSEKIYASMGGALSERTIRRRQRELKAGTKTNRTETQTRRIEAEKSRTEPNREANESEEDVPENVKPEDIDHWLRKLQRLADVAEAQGNLSALASIAAKVAVLLSLKHRTAPLPKPEPNADPFMIEAKKAAKERFLALIADALRGP